ncbi:hypothetical protein GUITHDRAFT_163217 [Guillardia theta CCMP2712]|uniref:Uncharacterized protein n=1 Tax=Guillardia theta (strain CCMP2712) TaxID=905079 RepID=L1JAQ8_GUITC|nr:hypothetical protein GUITHDRAFT_163217 [Guillardia theta CCMP2712]EKX45628.1 hypothetical protein GUITHDRAFT_163217 [Guillardia theta CCMP2712]|eukprot:XP_005832608.1 hypothetical protein GUITHDRAFT_163217 [Guillardia theta CCMP2712]
MGMFCMPYTFLKRMILAQRQLSVKGQARKAVEAANNLALLLSVNVKIFVRSLVGLSAVALSPCEPHGPVPCSSAFLALRDFVADRVNFACSRIRAEASHLASHVIAVLSDDSLISRSKAFLTSLENREIQDLLRACRPDVHLSYFSSVQFLSACPRIVNLSGIHEIAPCKPENLTLKGSTNVSSCSCLGYAGLRMFVKLLVEETLDVKFSVFEDEIVSDQVKRLVQLSGTETQHGRAAMAAQDSLFHIKLGFDKWGKIYKISYSIQSVQHPKAVS